MEVTWEEIETNSEKDYELQLVRVAIQLDQWSPELRRYEAQKKYLNFLGFLIFKDNRVVLPKSLHQRVMNTAHGGHVGEVAMKRIMRDFFWWPGMSADVEKFVKGCETCIRLSRKNPPVPLSSRILPDGPWQILQIDFLSEPGFGSGEFLVVVDIFSRYLSVVEMKHMDADSTNAALCQIFQIWGCPLILQSDNGPPFQSAAFIKFWEDKGVKVRKSIPLSPQSNGAVERQNQGITKALAASKIERTNWRRALQLYTHNHNTLVPHSRLAVTPFELMVGWKFRGIFPCLWSNTSKMLDHTDIRERDAETKLVSKKDADSARGAKTSDIRIGDTVFLAQLKKSKTDPVFSSEQYKVVARDGPKIVVMSRSGIQYARNVQDVKRVPMVTQSDEISASVFPSEEDELLVFPEGSSSIPAQTHPNRTVDVPPLDDSNADLGLNPVPQASASKGLRRREIIKRPSRFDNNFVYAVFQ
ncbi:uncharacterized protein K02A2.6-like [Ochlerotatus camptorhynchus]|uniref:uncharacterized protein K02A2.6-like n=1 Tax=Ochlerotatus camptorhynchus TaxID=644619 RepID=UPI0031D86B2F